MIWASNRVILNLSRVFPIYLTMPKFWACRFDFWDFRFFFVAISGPRVLLAFSTFFLWTRFPQSGKKLLNLFHQPYARVWFHVTRKHRTSYVKVLFILASWIMDRAPDTFWRLRWCGWKWCGALYKWWGRLQIHQEDFGDTFPIVSHLWKAHDVKHFTTWWTRDSSEGL